MDLRTVPTIDVAGASAAVAAGDAVLLDVREYDEWMTGRAPVALHLAMSELPGRVGELPRDRQILCICRSGNRSARVVAWLVRQGLDAIDVRGGMTAWAAEGNPVVNHAGNPGFVS